MGSFLTMVAQIIMGGEGVFGSFSERCRTYGTYG